MSSKCCRLIGPSGGEQEAMSETSPRTFPWCVFDGKRFWHVVKLAKRQDMVTVATWTCWFYEMLQQKASTKPWKVPGPSCFEKPDIIFFAHSSYHICFSMFDHIGNHNSKNLPDFSSQVPLASKRPRQRWLSRSTMHLPQQDPCPDWAATLSLSCWSCHSLSLGFLSNILRMGPQDGFGNEMLKKTHDVGTRVIRETKLSLHENVLEYLEDFRTKCIINCVFFVHTHTYIHLQLHLHLHIHIHI